ncbi:f54e2401-dc04-4221-8435-fb0a6ab57f65 [Thermothielavioides terrestris]|uniref:F54e2401-dc04-4221-8435-fb0a6ab57f65 n=1 Tax=Thermothielavioides terrestris TaxID=2587410 RepID=A0A3S5CXT2_9PEZI|nr:f54e2401-dc04-4221-8435-fb0a6ab57f65 [Thermothielavioides terrestris]
MSSTSSVPSKAPSAPAPANHPPAAPAVSNISFDTNRRQTQGPLHVQATPRKGQGLRKQHRNQRRAGTPGHIDEEDAMAEIRALRNASSRRGQMSITHLMSYALPPRPQESYHAPYSRSYRRNPSWGVGSGYHAADKARYIHANYRFVVNPNGSYAAQAADADEHIDWGDVLQVIASAESQQTSCPICLSEPVAPRMAKCGHIFCLPCLIRFMNSSAIDQPEKKQNRWRKCPICEDSVYLSDVRPVRFYAGQECPLPRKGDDVILRLMVRSSRSTLALPKEGATEVLQSGEDVPWHYAANVLDYARIMRGTSDYMMEQFDREIEELLKQEKEDELLYNEDNEWTQKAIKAIRTAKEKAAELGKTETAASDPLPEPGLTKQTGQDFYYFYTSPPHLYLSPLDIRILKTKYGSFSAFPSTLLPRVEHISTGHVVDDGLRKRAKYLGHLPRGCLISFLECDWTDIVPPEILATFSDEIERRRRRNKEKAIQEERERLQAERLEAAAIRDARRHFGAIDEEVTVRFGNAGGHEPPVDLNDFIPLGAEGTTPPNPRAGFSSLSDMSTSPTGRRTVWGTPMVGGPPEAPPPRPHVDDGWLKDADVLETLGATDLAVQLEALGVESEGASSSAAAAAGGSSGAGGKKKKKKQKITLMSTGGRRGL